jgi:DNA polymerase-3 subunit gamma/tau
VPKQIATQLLEWTGLRWIVSISNEQGGATIDEQDQDKKANDIAAVSEHPLIAATLTTFPGASVTEIRPVDNPQDAPPQEEDSFDEKGDASHA